MQTTATPPHPPASEAKKNALSQTRLSIIIPVYNEWTTINELLDKLLALQLNKEIIVVDDGSNDGTSEILDSFSHPLVRIFRHPKNCGKGAAIRTGLSHCTGDVIILQDADMEQVPEEIYKLIEPVLDGRAEVVYGSRLLGKKPEMTFSAYMANLFLSGLTSLLYFRKISDMETAYKVFKREVIQSIPFDANGFEFEPEMTAKILKKGIRIYEIPVKMDWFRGYDNNTKKITWLDGVKAVLTLLKYRFR